MLAEISALGNTLQGTHEILSFGSVLDSIYPYIESFGAYNEGPEPGYLATTLFQLTKTLKEWGTIACLPNKHEKYPTGEPIEDVYRKLLNMDWIVKGQTEQTLRAAFKKWLAWVDETHNCLTSLENLGVDLSDPLFSTPEHEKIAESLLEELQKEGGGALLALRRARTEGYGPKLWSSAKSGFKLLRSLLKSPLGNLAQILNNPLAVSLDRLNERRLARTEDGLLAMVSANSEIGDGIALVSGSPVPFVVRLNGDVWQLVGSAYVHGAMYGEMWDRDKCYKMFFA